MTFALSTANLKEMSPQTYFARSFRRSWMTDHVSYVLDCRKKHLDKANALDSYPVEGIVVNFSPSPSKLNTTCQTHNL